MRSVKVLAVLLPLLCAAGCKRKKPTPPDDEPAAAAKAQRPTGKPGKDWSAPVPKESSDLEGTVGGGTLPAETPPGGKPGWGLPPAGPWTNPAPGVQPPAGAPPAAPGTGVTPTAPKFKPVTEADLLEIWTFVENRSGATGQMPTAKEIADAVVTFGFSSGPLVKDGSITITGATTRESVWAYETRALTAGGLVVTNNKVETLTAAELKRRLGK